MFLSCIYFNAATLECINASIRLNGSMVDGYQSYNRLEYSMDFQSRSYWVGIGISWTWIGASMCVM